MSELSPCPKCACVYSYELGELLACPECGHEWSAISVEVETSNAAGDELSEIKDTAGNILQDGDTVTVVKDLKVKGRPVSIKVGTKVRNIRLVRDNGDHDIDCKVDGFGAMYLKSSVVRKV
jgi:protein PhnA